MGAFERVMGDTEEHYQAKQRSKHLARSPDPSNAAHAGIANTNAGAGSGNTRKIHADGSGPSTSALPLIRVSPKLIDFGMANVGARTSAKFAVENQSDVLARVEFRFVSKVLSLDQEELIIPPRQSVDVRVDFFPRRVNHTYRKQVTVANMLNRANDEILEVCSQNIDEQKIGFHSLFYRILTSTGSNFVDFGDVNINCTRLRSFGIENVSKGPLSIELSAAQPEDVKLYVRAEQDTDSDSSQRGSQPKYAPEDSLSTTSVEAEPPKSIKAKLTAHLKERFLETMSQESPANIRNENTSWRTAQKQRHFAKAGAGAGGKNDKSEKREQPKRGNINLVSALKKGGKGRLTMRYGKGITFKDRTLLRDFEYLDLASGPPVDDRRISVKSKKYQMLDAQETGRGIVSNKGRHTPDLTAKKGTGSAQTTSTSGAGAHGDGDGKNSTQYNALPAALARDIHHEGGRRTQGSSARASPALTGKRKAAPMLYDSLDVSKLSLDELIAAVESLDCSLSSVFLSNPRAEEQSVRTEVNLQRELTNAISESRLLPIEMLVLEPGEEKQVLAIYTPNGSTRPHIVGNARKQDSRIFIRLVDFSTEGLTFGADLKPMLQLDHDELPVRELMVKSNLCRSLMELSQPHINFGHMQKGETKARKIVIQNRSEWALRYCIRKSGSIASGDIKIKSTDRYGVVPGHGKREVEFVFCPSLTGLFQERLIVENVADRDRDEIVLIKANVARMPNFSVEPKLVSFFKEDVDADELAANGVEGHGSLSRMGHVTDHPCSFIVSNLSSKTRSFVLHIDDDDLSFGGMIVDAILSLSCQDGDTRPTLTKAEEEEVETISQKLKIANRKGQVDKIKKYQDRLTELGLQPETREPAQPAQESGEKEAAPTPLLSEGQSAEGDVDGAPNTESGSESIAPSSVPPDAPLDDTPRPKSPASGGNHETGASMLAPVPTAPAPVSSSLRRVAATVTLTIAAQQSKRMFVRLHPRLRDAALDASGQGELDENSVPPALPMDISVPVQVHEVKNIDEMQVVEVRARVYPPNRAVAADPSTGQSSSQAHQVLDTLLKPYQSSSKEEGLLVLSPARREMQRQAPASHTRASSPSPPPRTEAPSTPVLGRV